MKKVLAILLCGVFLFGCSTSSTSSQTSSKAENGDVVKIDFVGKMDGTAFNGGAAQGQLVELGAGGFIPGFEEGIVGMKAGETKNVNVTFPTNYYEELAGKEAVFEITVQKVYKEVK